jgi:hypothetical protein
VQRFTPAALYAYVSKDRRLPKAKTKTAIILKTPDQRDRTKARTMEIVHTILSIVSLTVLIGGVFLIWSHTSGFELLQREMSSRSVKNRRPRRRYTK